MCNLYDIDPHYLDPFEDTGTENLRRFPLTQRYSSLAPNLSNVGKVVSRITQPELKPEVVIYSRERLAELIQEGVKAWGQNLLTATDFDHAFRPDVSARFIADYIIERTS